MWVLVGTILATGQFAAMPVHYPSKLACEKRIEFVQMSDQANQWKFKCYEGETK